MSLVYVLGKFQLIINHQAKFPGLKHFGLFAETRNPVHDLHCLTLRICHAAPIHTRNSPSTTSNTSSRSSTTRANCKSTSRCNVGDPIRLATAGKGNLNHEKLKPLHHRQVKLYPDLGPCEKWQTIAASLPNVTVIHHPRKTSTPAARTQALDLADYLLDVLNPPL